MELAQASGIVNNPHPMAQTVAKEGMPIEVELIISFKNVDKSMYIILEKSNSKTNTYLAANMGLGSLRDVSSTTITADEAYIIMLSPDKDVEWTRVVQKRQVEHERKIYISTVAIKDNRDGLHLLFNDDVENSEAEPLKEPIVVHLESLKKVGLCDVFIDRAGKTTKAFIQEYKDLEQYFSPYQTIVAGNKMVYTAYRQRNAGKSNFRLGLIVVQ